MPHYLSAITITICNVMHNWKQLIPNHQPSSLNESSVNALVMWCLTIWVPSQLLKTADSSHKQNLSGKRAVSMLSSCDASFECHHNFNVQCCAQLKTADSSHKQNLAATRAVSVLSSCDASPFECHHNFNVQCCAQLKTDHSNTNKI